MVEQSEKNTVVLVDDEEIVLTSLSSFLNLETEYNVVTFISANEALEYITGNGCDLVISDYLMPEMDGITFLAKVKEIQPEVPRIILTGYADKENAIKAINDVGLYQYIEKPWDNEDILIIIRNGLERQRLMKKLQQKIDQINSAYAELQGLHKEIVKTFV
ncbi:MAG: response regulator [Candidatus Zixiibacteriota bacterium]|jgi:DNA-binding NtrC family response regulator|nr:MAG: response regulator [candidate division Zixibacteria bacterium]